MKSTLLLMLLAFAISRSSDAPEHERDPKYISLKGDRRRKEYEERGKEMLRKGVGVLTLAGGEGTRLGTKGPKGLFELPPGSGNTLFLRQARKIEKRAPQSTWIVMVSSKTRAQTVPYLPSVLAKTSINKIYVIEQDDVDVEGFDGLPLKDKEGGIIRAPNGNGGVFKALHGKALVITKEGGGERNSMVEELRAAGVECLNIVSIDNVLVNILDPGALGFLSANALEVVSSGVPLREGAKMGVFLVKEGGHIHIREYLDAPEPGSLMVQSGEGMSIGNIANHTLATRYLERVKGEGLEYHKSPKKIPNAEDEQPKEPNGIKKELFIFDQFNGAESGVFEVGESGYEGLKNREGERESIESCLAKLRESGAL